VTESEESYALALMSRIPLTKTDQGLIPIRNPDLLYVTERHMEIPDGHLSIQPTRRQ